MYVITYIDRYGVRYSYSTYDVCMARKTVRYARDIEHAIKIVVRLDGELIYVYNETSKYQS